MYSKEKAMILDSLVAIESLRAVRFKLVIRRVLPFLQSLSSVQNLGSPTTLK